MNLFVSHVCMIGVVDWYRIYSAHNKNPSKWTNEKLSRAICYFDMIRMKNDSIAVRSAYTCKIAFFRTCMSEVREALQVESIGPPKNTRKKLVFKKVMFVSRTQ